MNPEALLMLKDAISNNIIIVAQNNFTTDVSFPSILFTTIKIKIHAVNIQTRNMLS